MPSLCYKLRYMDYELAARELVRALRGTRSQAATARRLKRTSNVLHAWEVGTRYPRASDLLKLLQLSGHAPQPLLSRFAPCSGGTPRQMLASWLAALARNRPASELARELGVNRNTVARWLEGDTEPRLPQLLAFVQVTTQRVLELLTAMADARALPGIAAAHADLRQQRELAYAVPWTHAVLRALELEQYRALPRHQPGFVAACTGLSLEEEERCLAALLACKQIRRRSGRYVVRRVLSVDTREDPARNLALKQHWFEVGASLLRRQGIVAGGLASYNLFAISERDFARVRQAHLDYYERLRGIVAESREPSRVVLATVGLLPLGDSP